MNVTTCPLFLLTQCQIISELIFQLHYKNLDITNLDLYNKVLGVKNVYFAPEIAQYAKKNLKIMKPPYSKQILPVPWTFLN